jgi:ribonucleoside-diphosphate reductase alpha chain
MTGIASGKIMNLDLSKAVSLIKEENKRIANIIGINPAARLTCVKPAGTTSLALGTSSGIHAWHNKYYIRRLRVGKNEAIYSYLEENHPELIEDEYFRPHDTAVISVPQKAPECAILRSESAIDLLERIRFITNKWVRPGYIRGQNTHNVSATISIKEGEWESVAEWMWQNRGVYNGLSVLPYSDHSYIQAPFEDCDKEVYNNMMDTLKDVDLDLITELLDNTNLAGELACSGGSCAVSYL